MVFVGCISGHDRREKGLVLVTSGPTHRIQNQSESRSGTNTDTRPYQTDDNRDSTAYLSALMWTHPERVTRFRLRAHDNNTD